MRTRTRYLAFSVDLWARLLLMLNRLLVPGLSNGELDHLEYV